MKGAGSFNAHDGFNSDIGDVLAISVAELGEVGVGRFHLVGWLGVARGDEKNFPHMWNKLNRKMQNC